jgi:hypothetical protein
MKRTFAPVGEQDDPKSQKSCFCSLPASLHDSDRSFGLSSLPATDADALLAKELNQLTLEQRERVFDDVHGVAKIVEETPIYISERLVELDEEISRTKRRPAYERALFLSPKHVNDEKFRLMFLRAECFDALKAARRMVKYFEHKLELFGLEKLVKDISLDDLDQDDRATLDAGALHILPRKDSSGRTVMFTMPKLHQYEQPVNQVSKTTRGAGGASFEVDYFLLQCLTTLYMFYSDSSLVVCDDDRTERRRSATKRLG